MPNNLISILLPVYNAAPFLNACLDSVLTQTETNWELIAINDFSEDESKQILEQYAQKDQRIQVVQNTEKGIIPALRLALEKSKGTLITRMDADDLMQPQKLAQLKKILLNQDDCQISTGLVQYFSEEQLGQGYQNYANWLNELLQSENPYTDIYKECILPSPCWMMRKKHLAACGGFDNDIYPEDYDLCFRFYKKNYKVAVCPEVLHLWRDHPTRSSRTQKHYSNQRFFDLKLDYFFQLDYYFSRPIVIWGAGKKGKQLAQKLRDRGKEFLWVCNNPKKVGKEILDVKLMDYRRLPTIWQPQILITVAAPDGQEEIQAFLDQHQYERNYHYFYFV